MSTKQRTLKKSVSLSGIGLHTGETVKLTINPAPDNHGYKFRRTDIEGQPVIPADPQYVVSTQRGTTLKKGDAVVHTTEHVLSAIYGCKVDNALIDVDGAEIPILDGSAQPFVEAILEAGFEEQEAERQYLVLTENITYEDKEKNIEMLAVPTDGGEFRITVMVDYNSPVLGTQHASMYSLNDFTKEISSCRTFVFLKELSQLAQAGLIKGGDLDNAIGRIALTGSRVLSANLTSPDLAGLGLAVCRVVVPGYQPLHPGHALRALGGDRLFEVPQKLGYRGIPRGSAANPLPHPFR